MAPFAETQPGITAFDTYVSLGIQLINEGLFEPLEWVEKVTSVPAQVANMTTRWKDEAGWVLVDPELSWTVSKDTILSQGKILHCWVKTLGVKYFKLLLTDKAVI